MYGESPLDRIERCIREMKEEPVIYLESTRRYVQPDPEDVDSIYDTCDTLGPWHTLDDSEKRAALEDFDWEDVSPEDKARILERELTGHTHNYTGDATPASPPLLPLNERGFLGDEWTHDHELRYLDDRGVKYEDAVERRLDHEAEGLPTPADLADAASSLPPMEHGGKQISPADLAEAVALMAKMKASIQEPLHIGEEHAGQLSPPPTPGIEPRPDGGGGRSVTDRTGISRSRGRSL